MTKESRRKRIRCHHQYKGLFGRYVPRFKRTRNGLLLTQYKCQIIGCNHWQTRFVNKI